VITADPSPLDRVADLNGKGAGIEVVPALSDIDIPRHRMSQARKKCNRQRQQGAPNEL
jgi:hypothetical protein